MIEALELLSATPHDLAATVRDGGGSAEWLWKGGNAARPAEIEVVLENGTPTGRPLRYRPGFTAVQSRVEIVDEAIEEAERDPGRPDTPDVYFYYRFQQGHPVINVLDHVGGRIERRLRREDLLPDQSVLAQRKDPEQYPEVTWTGRRLGAGPSGNGRSAATSRSGSRNRRTFPKTACSRTAATWRWCWTRSSTPARSA